MVDILRSVKKKKKKIQEGVKWEPGGARKFFLERLCAPTVTVHPTWLNLQYAPELYIIH